jgi:hypothetical protein
MKMIGTFWLLVSSVHFIILKIKNKFDEIHTDIIIRIWALIKEGCVKIVRKLDN